jgi:hypothetical protein
MDPGFSFIPKGIMDWAMKIMVIKMITDILNLGKKFKGSKWEDR